MTATLPEDLEEATVDSMMTGETAFIVPWGMWVDADRKCWLNPKYSVRSQPHGTAEMRIVLCGDGFHVWPPVGRTWQPQAEPGYVGQRDAEYLPVMELHP